MRRKHPLSLSNISCAAACIYVGASLELIYLFFPTKNGWPALYDDSFTTTVFDIWIWSVIIWFFCVMIRRMVDRTRH